MRKRFVIVTIAVVIILVATTVTKVANPLNLGINPLMVADSQKPTGRSFEISFSYENLALVASNQYAFWIEDMDGNYIDTLYVTRYTSQEGHRRRPNSIPKWVSAAGIAEMRNSEIDAIAGATPKSGSYLVYWDFRDSNGNAVEGTEYRYFVEASVMNSDTVIYSGIIKIGEETWVEQPTPEYSNPNSEYNAMLSNVRVAYYPN
jgi:hypothetical protein